MLGWIKRINRWSDRRLLEGLPEYGLFPSEESRQAAVKELDEGLERSNRFWLSIVVVVAALIVVSIAARLILARTTGLGSGWISLIVFPSAIVIGYALVVWIWRRGVARHMREKLVDAGVPVCLRCGYQLRGIPEARCPECGWAVNEAVWRLMGLEPDEKKGAVRQR